MADGTVALRDVLHATMRGEHVGVVAARAGVTVAEGVAIAATTDPTPRAVEDRVAGIVVEEVADVAIISSHARPTILACGRDRLHSGTSFPAQAFHAHHLVDGLAIDLMVELRRAR